MDLNGIDAVEDCRELPKSIYQPIHLQSNEERHQVKNFMKFIKGASNYALYSLQQSLPGDVQLCTFDPLVWLPPELIEAILCQVCVQDLLALTCLNKTWNRYMSSHPAWRGVCGPNSVDPACARLCRTDGDWMVASRDALVAQRALRTKGGLILKKIRLSDLSECVDLHRTMFQLHPDCVVANDGVICAGFDNAGSWLIHDTTFGRSWYLNRGSPVTCYRFINASKSSKKALQHVGLLLYGTSDGSVRAPLEHLLSSRLDYRRHAGSVISCDADMDTEIVASIGRDWYLRIFGVWSMAMLCAVPIDASAEAVHVLPPHNGHFAVLVSERKGAFTKYSWPIAPGDPEKCKTNIETLNPTSNHFYENIYDTFTKYGDFLNIKQEKLVLDHLDGEDIKSVLVQADSGTIGAVVIQSNEKANAILVYDAHTLRPLFRRPVSVKVSQLVGVGRRFAVIIVSGAYFVNDRLGLLDLHMEHCLINTLDIAHMFRFFHPMKAVHGCPAFQALDFLPVTDLRRARHEALHGGISSRFKRRRCIDLQHHDSDRVMPPASERLSVGSGKVGAGHGDLLNVDPMEMEQLSQLEDDLSSTDFEHFAGETILYAGYDDKDESFGYVTWDLLAGQKEPRRDKLKGE